MNFESPEEKENLSERQREILEATGCESKKQLQELVNDLIPDSEEHKYFTQVLKQIEENNA